MNWRSGSERILYLDTTDVFHSSPWAPFLQGMTSDECNDGWIHGSQKSGKQLPGKDGINGDGFWALGFDGNA